MNLCPSFVLTLKRTPERLLQFQTDVRCLGPLFPFDEPKVFYGINGHKISPKQGFFKGAWGAQQSHLHIWETCLTEDIFPFTVFEDDVIFAPDFCRMVPLIYPQVSLKYSFIFWGGRHRLPKEGSPLILDEHTAIPYAMTYMGGYTFFNASFCNTLYKYIVDGASLSTAYYHIDWQIAKYTKIHFYDNYRDIVCAYPNLIGHRGGSPSATDNKGRVKSRDTWRDDWK
jgi:GR25 family glycosyltransferase involved in LPS biosynthesis